MHCPACSAENAAESRFCSSCGGSLASVSQVVTAAGAGGAAMAVGVGRLISSDSIPVGGLTPGAVLIDRYRIIGLLGRGGMGEVYRADDLKLGQPVALKFLSSLLSSDPVRRERFFAEVRITRQLAHPNICRVYDIADVNGQHFLSMEFIDGEDLASLLKRIGYLSNEKALDITRQLVAGLTAAHERGVLHRDLKPANIMIDGRGRVRITDFGLAVAETDESTVGDVSGTPAYMAPEQLAGKGATVRSDIYALGLVLYEILSGKKAFSAVTLGELRSEKEQSTPTAPSELRPGIDPVVERLVMRCLERDPRSRPSSVAQLAMALPGGDPLAAAIAAGETPSPELVAASGEKEGLRPGAAIALLTSIAVGALAVIGLAPKVALLNQISLEKTPDALADRAREVLKKIGYASAGADRAYGFIWFDDFLNYVRDDARSRRDLLNTFEPAVFWYRESPQPLVRSAAPLDYPLKSVTSTEPPVLVPGEIRVRFNPDGRLRSFEAIPPVLDAAPSDHAAPTDWTPLFSDAGLDIAEWRPTRPQWNPNYYADTRAAWEGSLPEAPNVPLRIEAAALHGRPISFLIVGPWSRPLRGPEPPPMTVIAKVGAILIILVLAAVMGGGLFFARRNLRLGRGDRRGAIRLSAVMLALHSAAWLSMEHHVAGFSEFYLFFTFVPWAVFLAGLVWILYVALEPLVRRRWPHMLVSWARLWSGAWRDPIVGRDVLIGCAAGVFMALAVRLTFLLVLRASRDAEIPFPMGLETIGGTLPFFGILFHTLHQMMLLAFGQLFLLFLLRILIKNQSIAIGAFVALWALPDAFSVPATLIWVVVAVDLVFWGFALWVTVRFGLVPLVVTWFIYQIVQWRYPLTFQTSAWYAGYGYAALAIVGVIAFYGFKISLGGRRLVEIADA